MAETPDAALEPILIAGALSLPAANGARHVALADGDWRGEALAFDRGFLLFDNSHILDARASWYTLGAAEGGERHSWKKDERGGWSEGPCSRGERRRGPWCGRRRCWARKRNRTN